MKKISVVLILMFFGVGVYAQNTRSAETPKPPRPQYQAVKKEKKGLFSFLKKKDKGNLQKTNQEEIAEFRARIKKVYREKAKEEKLSNKKRYKEHGYFGHKRPPKKRPPGKQKFCKVCKMKH